VNTAALIRAISGFGEALYNRGLIKIKMYATITKVFRSARPILFSRLDTTKIPSRLGAGGAVYLQERVKKKRVRTN
jgi:hypothetical protein